MNTLLFLCFTIFHVIIAEVPKCSINIKKGMDKISPPMLISPTKPPTYIYPKMSDPENIILNEGEKILIVCPARTDQKSTRNIEDGVILVKNATIKSNSETLECINNDQFKIQGETINFNDISCEVKQRASYSAILKKSKQNCTHGERYEIGYDLGNLGFLKTIELCHDIDKAKTLWSHAQIIPANQEFTRYSGGSMKNFKAASLYEGMSMSTKEPYNLQVAYKNLQGIFGDGGNVDHYLSPKISTRKFLAKGHLVANADKFYKSEQESTYFYANVVPMWQVINAIPGNWFVLEEYVRHLAFNKHRQLEVYVGGLGILQLEAKNLTLYDNDKIPVPKILYKCVIDRQMNEALCFMVVNNPYVNDNEIDDYVICKRKKKCHKFLENSNDTTLGYLYCCNMSEFYKAVKSELGLDELKTLRKFKELQLVAMDKKIRG